VLIKSRTPAAIATRQDAEAVVLDLVQPVRAAWDRLNRYRRT
jgi:hypothetical protein